MSATSTEPVQLPSGDDLGRALGTDFFGLEDRLTDQERAVRDRVRAFCDDVVVPRAAAYWEAAELPADIKQGYGDLGIAGGSLSGYGCPGFSPLLEGIVVAELARGDGSLSTLHAVHSGLAMASIGLLGSPEQQQRWLPAMADFTRTGAFALTEPTHGSDVVTLETSARRDGSDWVLNGAKRWIGNGHIADVVVVWARDEDGDVGGFVVEHPDGVHDPLPGYDAVRITGKTAGRGISQAQIALHDVRIPLDNRLAGARSFADTNIVLAKSRQTVAWEGLGHAIGAYEAAVTYAKRREQFGRPIAKFQLVQDKLAHMLTEITAMQMVCARLAEMHTEHRATIEHAALAKLQTAAGARSVCAQARDILGGNGILLDHHVARHHADIETVYTYEGTDSVQSLIVGRAITGMSAFV